MRARLLLCAPLLLASSLAHAASFDCSRASSKLTRAICADPDLSQLDEQVWNAYGERIKTLTHAQYEQVRDRHITWRRQRGRYDRGMAAMADDYRRHLAWLNHPLLPLEGRYERGDGAEISVEIDMQSATPALIALGRLGRLQWLPPLPGSAPNVLRAGLAAGAPQPALPWREDALTLMPAFVGAPYKPVRDCAFTLRWNGDALRLGTQGECGADFAGEYAMQGPAKPWPRWQRPTEAKSP